MDNLVEKLVCFLKKCYNYCITKLFWLKYKRAILIVCATLFLVVLFVARNGIPFFEKTPLQKLKEEKGLIYGDATVASLIESDTDEDGVLDWEEALWGLDPAAAETNPGVPDGATVAKLKAAYDSEKSTKPEENLTETDKFSRELLSTLVALNQNGTVDDETIEKISASLMEHLQTRSQENFYELADLKLTQDDSKESYAKFNLELETIDKKIPLRGNVSAILDAFVNEGSVDVDALAELDPIITQINTRLDAALAVPVPESLAPLYLKFLNASKGLAENLSDLKLYDQDPIITLGAIAQYEQNITVIAQVGLELTAKIKQKLSY